MLNLFILFQFIYKCKILFWWDKYSFSTNPHGFFWLWKAFSPIGVYYPRDPECSTVYVLKSTSIPLVFFNNTNHQQHINYTLHNSDECLDPPNFILKPKEYKNIRLKTGLRDVTKITVNYCTLTIHFIETRVYSKRTDNHMLIQNSIFLSYCLSF
jgi:hypothetical protein